MSCRNDGGRAFHTRGPATPGHRYLSLVSVAVFADHVSGPVFVFPTLHIWAPLPTSELHLHMGTLTQLIHGNWAHPSPQPTRHLDRFGRFRVAHFTKAAPSLPQNCPLASEIRTPSNAWFLGLNRVHIPNDMSTGSAAFAGLTALTDRQTDRQTTLLRL